MTGRSIINRWEYNSYLITGYLFCFVGLAGQRLTPEIGFLQHAKKNLHSNYLGGKTDLDRGVVKRRGERRRRTSAGTSVVGAGTRSYRMAALPTSS